MTNYPVLDIFWTMLEFFLFFIWIWLLFMVISDIFRSQDLGGGGKAVWTIVVIILPYIGVLLYLIARGGGMHERAIAAAQQQQKAFDDYVKASAPSTSSSAADQLVQLAGLRDQGVITEAEFQAQKTKLLG